MKKLIYNAAILIALAPQFAQAALGACRAIFDPSRAEVRHRESVAGTTARERMTERELDLFLNLRASHGLKTEKLYERYDLIANFTRVERALIATPESIMRLAATSLKQGASIETTLAALDGMLTYVGRGLTVDPSLVGAMKVPHRVLFALAEAKIRTGIETEQIAEVYNAQLLEARMKPLDPAAIIVQAPADVALQATLAAMNP